MRDTPLTCRIVLFGVYTRIKQVHIKVGYISANNEELYSGVSSKVDILILNMFCSWKLHLLQKLMRFVTKKLMIHYKNILLTDSVKSAGNLR